MNLFKIFTFASYMRVLLLLMLFAALSCKNEISTAKVDKINQELAGENYMDIMRIPMNDDGTIDTLNGPKLVFDELSKTFDTITQGEVVYQIFKFSNQGNKDLYLLDTRSTCGCTASEYTETAVAPGQKGQVKVKFDSNDWTGDQTKKIRIFANTYPNEQVLELTGYVIKKPK